MTSYQKISEGSSVLAVFEYSKYEQYIDNLTTTVEVMGRDYERNYYFDNYPVPDLKFGKILRQIKFLDLNIKSLLTSNSIRKNQILDIGFKAQDVKALAESSNSKISPSLVGLPVIACPILM